MRILMLSQFYPPIPGGGAIQVRSLSIELASRGHHVAVVTLRHQGQVDYEMERGVHVYRIHSSIQSMPWLFNDNGRQHAPPYPDPKIMFELRRIILQERPEIVHGHNWLVYSFFPLKTWSGARLVVTLHNYSLVCVKTSLLYHGTFCEGPGLAKCLGCAAQFYGFAKGMPIVVGNRVMSMIERGLIDMFLPVSQATAIGNGLIDSHIPFQVVHNFIPEDVSMPEGKINPYLAQLPTQDYLLFVGALGYHKGVHVLLRAYAGLTNAPPLVLIGYQTPDWQTLAKECPPNVFVLTNWPRYAVMEAWRRSMIALVPSVWSEPFGLVVIEAMSAGRPVIASRTGGITDLVVDDETGFLIQPGDPFVLQRAIERLLADAELRKRMGQAALRKVVEFKASTIVSRIEYIYEELLQQGRLSQRADSLRNSTDTVRS